mmetsp:Transcript_14748/g.37102  ORF Transcript_14748/g.37102 Transcript_14748/m.37102 type:complete len:249 (-) Transcript_14748:273-1019(-)
MIGKYLKGLVGVVGPLLAGHGFDRLQILRGQILLVFVHHGIIRGPPVRVSVPGNAPAAHVERIFLVTGIIIGIETISGIVGIRVPGIFAAAAAVAIDIEIIVIQLQMIVLIERGSSALVHAGGLPRSLSTKTAFSKHAAAGLAVALVDDGNLVLDEGSIAFVALGRIVVQKFVRVVGIQFVVATAVTKTERSGDGFVSEVGRSVLCIGVGLALIAYITLVAIGIWCIRIILSEHAKGTAAVFAGNAVV